MGFAINTNLDALNAYQNLTNTQNAISKSLQQLSSGLRINNAGDDAAGMTISADIGAQISGLTKAQANAADGTSLVQTADGGLQQVQTLLGQLRDLAVQAANDSNSASARTAISTQANAIVSQIGQIAGSTNFNGINLLNGTASTLNFQVGANGNASSQISVNLNASGASANVLNVVSQLSTAASGSLITVGTGATQTGAFATALAGSTGVTFATSATNGSTASVTVNNLTDSTGAALTSSSSAESIAAALNANGGFAAQFRAVVQYTSGTATGIGIIAANGATAVTTAGPSSATYGTQTATTVGALNLATAAGAQSAITAIQTQLDNITSARANIGALENRFSAVSSAISTSVQNLTAANSRITDVDFASAMVTFSKQNILAQTGTAMLSQANSLPQLALKLLQG